MRLGLFIGLFLYCFTACAPKQSNEISEMALECFKAKKAIRIEFIPHPMSTSDLDGEEKRPSNSLN